MAVNWKMLAAVVLVVGMVGLVFVCLLYTLTGGEIPFDHGVIIDAGSSHSEVLLYRWEGDKYRGTGMVHEIANCGVEPGISSFTDPKDAGLSLLPCLNQVAEKIDPEKLQKVPVYLAATAGMRLLNISNMYQSIAIFTSLKCAIPRSKMMVMDVGIISGRDEGLFAWITTNFLLGLIQKKEHPTVGAADMGGASTQIAFEVPTAQPDNPNVVSLKLYGEPYHVYSVTYLCYGSMEIWRRYLASLIEDPSTNLRVDNPCGNAGQELIFDAVWLLDQPCTKTREVAKWVFLNPEKMNTNYTFVGTADVEQCKERVEKLFNPEECDKSYGECFRRIDPLERPKKFMTFSSYYWTMDFMKSVGKSLEEYVENVKVFCEKEWSEVDPATYPKTARGVLPRYCFQGIMVQVILTSGYGFNTTTWSDIQFTRKVNGTGVGWALGYMTNATNAIPRELPTLPMIGTAAFVVLLIISLALLAVGAFMCTRAKRRTKHVNASQVP